MTFMDRPKRTLRRSTLPRRGIAPFIAAVSVLGGPAAAQVEQMRPPLNYAHCAGIADAMMADAHLRQDRGEMDYFAEESRLFMALARRDSGGVSLDVLQRIRSDAVSHLFHEGATDDSIHVMVQECSDLRQQLTREGRFTDER